MPDQGHFYLESGVEMRASGLAVTYFASGPSQFYVSIGYSSEMWRMMLFRRCNNHSNTLMLS